MRHQERIESLRARHEALESKLDFETNRPHPDEIVVSELKKQKLRIKDEIENLVH